MSADNHLNDIVQKLFAQAVKDDIITDEEYFVIQSIEFEMDDYILTLEKALDDGIIDDTEKTKLQKLQEKIIDKAEKQAVLDGIVDEDEKELIAVLKKILINYFK